MNGIWGLVTHLSDESAGKLSKGRRNSDHLWWVVASQLCPSLVVAEDGAQVQDRVLGAHVALTLCHLVTMPITKTLGLADCF